MVAIIPFSFARVEPPLIYETNWTLSISPSMVPDKRENVPLMIRVKKLICQLCFLVRNQKFQITYNLFWFARSGMKCNIGKDLKIVRPYVPNFSPSRFILVVDKFDQPFFHCSGTLIPCL